MLFSLEFGRFPSLMPVIAFSPLSPCLLTSEVFGCQVVGVFIFLRYTPRTSILENHREESLIKCKRHSAAIPPPPLDPLAPDGSAGCWFFQVEIRTEYKAGTRSVRSDLIFYGRAGKTGPLK